MSDRRVRDVKPSNIMLSSAGEVKLLDLGLARFQSASGEGIELTGTGQAMGTADYIAPEQVTDSRSVDVRVDIYALGCTLFKLITGTAPFAADQYPTAFAKMTAHVSSEPPSLRALRDDAPARLVKLVDAMLSKEPDARPQTPQSVAEKLSLFTSGANLIALSQLADALQPGHAEANGQRTSSPSAAARRKPWLHRRVPMLAAIGAGFFGLLLGLCMGVLIEIKYPDGTTVAVAAPEGSEVTVRQAADGSATARPPVAESGLAEPMEVFSGPLQFAILLDEDNLTDQSSREAAVASLRQSITGSGGISRVETEAGIWFPVDEGVNAPITETVEGQRYALVSRDSEKHVPWYELRGQIATAQSHDVDGNGGRAINLSFAQPLSNRIAELTRENLREQLAIIVANRIVSAPTIHMEIRGQAELTGQFSPEEIRSLLESFAGPDNFRPNNNNTQSESIRGGLVEPLPSSAGAGADAGQAPVSMLKGSAEVKVKNSLKRMGLAFHNFHVLYGSMPGSTNWQLAASEKSAYPFSWRVAILPFLEDESSEQLYEQYRFDEPWDSEANLKLLEQMPAVYQNPFAPDDQPVGHTNYQGFATGESALGKNGGIPLREIRDGTSNTLLLIETKGSVPWTKPQDIEGKPEFFDDHPVHFVMADGSVHAKKAIDEDLLRKMITRDGGERIQLNR